MHPPTTSNAQGFLTVTFDTIPLALNQLPPPSALRHIRTVQSSNGDNTQQPRLLLPHNDDPIHYFVGAALPAVPPKLVERIESGAFVEMSDLLPEHLGQAALEEDSKSKSRHHPVSTITQWLQCFAVYTAVIARKHPGRVIDLMGYQILIIEAHHEYRNDSWLNYDRRFRLRVAAQPGRSWAAIDSTIWNLAFAGQAKATQCNHCFSFAHCTSRCHLNEGQPEKKQVFLSGCLSDSLTNRFRGCPICFKWNESKFPDCPHHNCRFEHVCYICASNPQAKSVNHKAVFCPAKQ